MAKRIKIELNLKDTEMLPFRQNVVKLLVKGIIDIVDKVSSELEDNEQRTIDTGEIGIAFAYALQNISDYIILDDLDNIVVLLDEDDTEGNSEIAGHLVEALGGADAVKNRKASTKI